MPRRVDVKLTLDSLCVLVCIVCVLSGGLHGYLLLLTAVLLRKRCFKIRRRCETTTVDDFSGPSASYLWDTGGRHWGELWDVGPLHSCVGRNIL